MSAKPIVTMQFLTTEMLPETEKVALKFSDYCCAAKGAQNRELSVASVDIRNLYDCFTQNGWGITSCNTSVREKRKNSVSTMFVLYPIGLDRRVKVVRGFRVADAFCALTRLSDWSMKVYEIRNEEVEHIHIVFSRSDRPIREKTQLLSVLNGKLYLMQQAEDDVQEEVAA